MPKVNMQVADRTLSAVRGDEPLSRRINQIVDRYLLALDAQQKQLRAGFTDGQWQQVLAQYPKWIVHDADSDTHMLRKTIEEATGRECKLDQFEVTAVLELIEVDLAKPPTAHS